MTPATSRPSSLSVEHRGAVVREEPGEIRRGPGGKRVAIRVWLTAGQGGGACLSYNHREHLGPRRHARPRPAALQRTLAAMRWDRRGCPRACIASTASRSRHVITRVMARRT